MKKKTKHPNPRKREPRSKDASRIRRAIPLLLLATLLTLVLDRFGAVRVLESVTVDFLGEMKNSRTPSAIALVLVGSNDKSSLYGASGLLDPGRLRSLISGIAATRPSVIVVAVDTADPRFAVLQQVKSAVPVVWSRGAGYSHRRDLFVAEPFLGGSTSGNAGIALYPEDDDGVVRRYYHLFKTDNGSVPSLAWAAVCAARHSDPIRTADPRNDFYLQHGIAAEPFPISASRVLELSRQPGWEGDSILTNKIVVIGGDSPGDEHRAAVRWKLGSEIVAQSVEGELAGRRIVPLSAPLLLLLQVLQGVALLVLFQAVTFRRALVVSLIAIPLVSLILSYASYSTLARWGQFAPILIVLVAAQVYERAREKQRDLIKTIAGEEPASEAKS